MEKDIKKLRDLAGDMLGQGNESTYNSIENVLKELERLELTLFMVVRNSKVLPTGIKLGKSEKEISDMTKDTIKELKKVINFDRAKELYNLWEK